ncbi:MAG TPA: response regulator [Burkholderiaceae bacterium]|nr:response regulator [Burkholderiaceae bacterium]
MSEADATRVLVVDDNIDGCRSLASLLELEGHRVLTAFDGRSAIELARSERPQVLIIDLSLPDQEGEEVARTLRAEPSLAGSTFIALSGREVQADTSGDFDHAILKPATLETLLACFQRATPG